MFHVLQVVTGGQYDVDVQLVSPTQEILYKQVKTQFDSHQFTAQVRHNIGCYKTSPIKWNPLSSLQATGIYAACFSNEFSTFSHKLIYMDFQVGDEQPLPGVDEHSTVLTQLESSSQEIHKSLNAILDYQTHHRLREAQGKWVNVSLERRLSVFLQWDTAFIFLALHSNWDSAYLLFEILFWAPLISPFKVGNERKIWTNAFSGGP